MSGMESIARAEAPQVQLAEAPDAPWLAEADAPPAPTLPGRALIAAGIAAFLWLALAAATFLLVADTPSELRLIDWAILAAGTAAPLALIGVALLLRLRWNALTAAAAAHNAARHFHEVGVSTRQELQRVQSLLGEVARHIDANGATLMGQTQQLLTAGDSVATQLSKLTRRLSDDTEALEQQAQKLEAATTATRIDLGVLMTDLPVAEERARLIGAALREAGVDAHAQVGGAAQLMNEIWSRSERAQTDAAIVAQRLTAQVEQLGSAASNTLARIDAGGEKLGQAVEQALERTGEALEATREGVTAQAAALQSAIERSQAEITGLGVETATAIEGRLSGLFARMDGLTERLAQQETAGRSLVEGLDVALAGLEARLAEFARDGDRKAGQLAGQFGQMRLEVERLSEPLRTSEEAGRTLLTQGSELRVQLNEIGALLDDVLPRSLASSGNAAAAARAVLNEQSQQVAELDARIASLETTTAAARTALEGGREEADNTGAAIVDRLGAATTQVEALRETLNAVGREADDVSIAASATLIETLARVRETANQAAETTRQTFNSVVAESHDALAKAGEDALRNAIEATVNARIEELEEASRRAEKASNAAAERLARQMLSIADTAASVEERIHEVNARAEAILEEDFSRRSALLIESLNSTAIDIAKLFSNEVTDTAWAAYLKGDRGVFTRRAVRLLEANEARDIGRLYEEDATFNAQVGRYIHDFEAMLRRILASRDGGPLSVALLSSDNGKLYVALAQAIERFRI